MRWRSPRCTIPLLLPWLALPVQACSSSYRPVASARIATTLDGGEVTLIKGDQEYRVGLLGSEVVQAVQGNPAAEEHARAFRNNMITGWTFYGVGFGVTLAGAGVFGAAFADSNGGNEALGLGVTAAGLGLIGAGIAFFMNAQPHLFDAINIYNDGIGARYAPPWRGQPPVWRAAPLSLAPMLASPVLAAVGSPQGEPLLAPAPLHPSARPETPGDSKWQPESVPNGPGADSTLSGTLPAAP